jgi:hypothetical protein
VASTKRVGRHGWAEVNKEWREDARRAAKARDAGSAALRRFWESRGCVRCMHDRMARYDVITLEEYERALERWLDPSTRRRDRFYCQRHTEAGVAGAARHWKVPGTLAGHVGWAFKMDSTSATYYMRRRGPGPFQIGSFGAGDAIPNTRNIVYVASLTADPVTEFTEFEYDAYKSLDVPDANFEAAVLAALEVSEGRYNLFGSNCLDATYRVLRAYGVQGLPAPSEALAPAAWFDRLPGRAIPLGSSR